MAIKFTRKQYLKGECTHQEYYLQFSTPQIIARVKRAVSVDVLKTSKDPGFSDVYALPVWDNAIGLCPHDVDAMMRDAGDYPTLAGMVSLAKCVARSLVTE